MSLRVAFIGGGSGGHLFPAVAIAQELLREDSASRFLFLTSTRAVDQQVLDASGLSGHEAKVVPYATQTSKRGLWNAALRLPSLWRSTRTARQELKSFQPDVVVGLGALASVPGIVAASRLGLPVVLLEHNSLPGKATRVLARRAKLTLFGLPVEENLLRHWPSPVKTCGTPVRSGIRDLAEFSVQAVCDRKRILILGGSQGSHSVNHIVSTAFTEGLKFPSDWEIVHQTGEAHVTAMQNHYQRHTISARVASFLPNMHAELSAAGIVISRAGAATIQELACAGMPTILIPLSTAADQHQMLNARLLERADATVVIDERQPDSAATIKDAIQLLLCNPEHRQHMAHAIRSFAASNAASEIAEILVNIADKGSLEK